MLNWSIVDMFQWKANIYNHNNQFYIYCMPIFWEEFLVNIWF